ncbi:MULTISPECIES: hypothetical protein [unclassified Nocardioides]|uniref:hypothetical protein n=1 Tax=unclassified Nocardioides TaxID=2615069 RepID=UPI000ABC1857|nr:MULTISPECIES: hypothetical protein [unclassified Nocardioides]
MGEGQQRPVRPRLQPRQAVGVARFLATHHRKRVHDGNTLDTIAQRYGVRSGPLAPAAPLSA